MLKTQEIKHRNKNISVNHEFKNVKEQQTEFVESYLIKIIKRYMISQGDNVN